MISCRTARQPRRGPFRRPEFEPESIDVVSADGTRLHVQQYGPADGEPIVLIHGFACAIQYWNPQISAFAERYRVIAFDQRGHGRSGRFRGPLTAGDLADDLSAVLAETVAPDQRATIVGHSMGGVTTIAWAAKYPHEVNTRVKSVLLADTASCFTNHRLHLLDSPDFLTRLQARALDAVLHTRLPFPALKWSRGLVRKVGLSEFAAPEAVEFVQAITARCPPDVRLRWANSARLMDVSDGVAALSVPTTVLYGALDGMLAPSITKLLADQVRAAGNLLREVELPKAGHATNLEDIDTFNAEIVALVTSSDSANRMKAKRFRR